ncbi:peptidoglycan-binding protein [Skermanella mucosa]|uniref:peptidoglycan-binding protein n=1 Tax=Skermanella mucosa TaxID=1789672 RepID=UPI00192AEEA3|nr:peptidoglycan-binding protein [Skermanella mucosa]UEM19030.1 peptidoglycan-binding protein [Skermanella mucosa]
MSFTELVNIPAGINPNVSSAKQATMLSLLGNPRQSYDQECREVTDIRLASLITFRTVGRLRVRGLEPAVDSLERVLADIESDEPDIYAVMGHAGMLCARNVRGSNTSISNHSWGTAIDLTLEGVLDRRGDGRVQIGLTRIAPIFNAHGWYWGAGFRTEDAMHFECSDELIRQWHGEGLLDGLAPATVPDPVLSLGDRGPEVLELQRKLNEAGAQLVEDGIFGRGTHAAVMAFQARNGLSADGVVGPMTREALGL